MIGNYGKPGLVLHPVKNWAFSPGPPNNQTETAVPFWPFRFLTCKVLIQGSNHARDWDSKQASACFKQTLLQGSVFHQLRSNENDLFGSTHATRVCADVPWPKEAAVSHRVPPKHCPGSARRVLRVKPTASARKRPTPGVLAVEKWLKEVVGRIEWSAFLSRSGEWTLLNLAQGAIK